MSQNMDKARGRVMLHYPFFGYLMVSASFIATDQIDTAAADGLNVYYNPKFIEGLSIFVAVFVIVHELCHNAFDHAGRRKGRDPDLWNQACDYAINIMLKDYGFTLWDKCLCDAKYRDWSPERIYDDLLRNPRPQSSSPLSGDMMPVPRTPEEQEAVTRKVRANVAQAVVMSRGSLPGSLEKAIGEVIDPGVPWEEVLRDKATRVVREEENWCRPNRRYRDFHLPSLGRERIGEFIAIGDTSGSFTAEDYKKAAGAINAAADAVKPSLIRVIWGDTKVQREEVFEDGDPLVFHPKGGGGTDMRVLLKHVEQYEPAFVVLMTDGFTPWPSEEPPYPLIVLCTTDVAVPIGEVIRV